MEKELTEPEKRQIKYLIEERGFSIEGIKPSFIITENIYHYVYNLKEGVFSFSKEYVDNNYLYLIQEFPDKKIDELPKKLKWEDFQNWIVKPKI
jgi:hypothetical protein